MNKRESHTEALPKGYISVTKSISNMGVNNSILKLKKEDSDGALHIFRYKIVLLMPMFSV